MSSNSIRISAELFARAQAEADVMSRSAAQQVEHWARMGAALEASGLTVEQARELIQRGSLAQAATREVQASEADLWRFKRARQNEDLHQVREGRIAAERMSWFSRDDARRAQVLDAPY